MLSHLVGERVMAPMELVDDPALQRWFVTSRGRIGVNIIPLVNARRAMLRALRGGHSVGIVVDRDLTRPGSTSRSSATRRRSRSAPPCWPRRSASRSTPPPRDGSAAGATGVVSSASPSPKAARAANASSPRRRRSRRPSRRCSPTPRSNGGARSTRSGRTSTRTAPDDGRDGQADPVDRLGRADLHIHTLASDGTAPVTAILDRVEREGVLDVVAITDHERIDAALAARRIALDRGCRTRVIVGEEISTRGGHLLGLFLERPVPALRSLRWSIAAVHEQGGIAIPAHPLVPYPLCAQAFLLRRLLDDADPAVRPDAIETFNPTALGRYWHERVVRFAAEHEPGPGRQQRRPRVRGDRHRLDDVPGPHRGRRCGPPSWRETTPPRELPRHGGAARDVRAPAAQVRPRRAGRGRRPVAPRRHRPGSRLPGRPPPAAALPAGRRRGPAGEDRARLAVRLPAAGRRHPARPLPLREPAAARPRRPDPDLVPRPAARVRGRRDPPRQGLLDAGQRLGGDGDASRSATSRQVREVLERERFDVLHFHEPFVPFLSLVILRESQSVNIATFHAYGGWSPAYEFGSRVMGGYADRLHGRIAVSAAARHFIDRYFPGDYKVIPNGVDVERFRRAVPVARWQDGTAEHPVRRAVRAAQGRARPPAGLPDPAQDRLRLPAAAGRRRAAGARGAALHRDPPAARRGVPGPRHGRREGAAVPDGRRLRLAGHRARVVRHRAARGDGRRGADRRLRHPRLQGRRAPRPRGAAGPAAPAEGPRGLDRAAARRAGHRRRDVRGRGERAPRSSAGRG